MQSLQQHQQEKAFVSTVLYLSPEADQICGLLLMKQKEAHNGELSAAKERDTSTQMSHKRYI